MNKYVRFLIVACMLQLGILGILGASTLTYAASSLVDPLVAIARDATNPGCEEVFHININTPFQTTTRIPCPTGTVMASTIVHRSQAIAQHESYVLLPYPQAPLTVWQSAKRQVQQLMHAKQEQLLQQARREIPSTRCGSSGSNSVYNWDPLWPDNTSYTSTEQFFKTSDCHHVVLEVASVHVNAVRCPYSWSHDQYQGGWFGVPGFPPLTSQGHTYSHSVDQTWDTGYGYETHVTDNLPGCYDSNGDFWCDILIN